MDLEEAHRVLDAAFPGQSVTVARKTPTYPYEVKRGEEILGKAFDLSAALRQACAPVLEAEKKRMMGNAKAREQEFILFMEFLRVKHDAEFAEFKAAKAAASAAPGTADGPQPDQKQLVQLVSG